MKKNFKKISLVGLIFIIGLALVSCDLGGGDDDSEKEVSFEDIDWRINNSPNYSNSTVKAWFDLYLSDIDLISSSDIQSVVITSPGGTYWEISTVGTNPVDMADYYDASDSVFSVGGLYRSSAYYDTFEVGTYTFNVTLTNGNSAETTRTIYPSGSASINGVSYMYSETYEDNGNDTSGSDSAAMIKRANITAATRSGSEITITYNVNDTKVYNGYAVLYNSSGDYIGTSYYFMDRSTDTLYSVFSGGTFDIAGGNSEITLNADNTSFNSGYTIDDVEQITIALIDGNQYTSNTNNDYDTKSYSEYFSIP